MGQPGARNRRRDRCVPHEDLTHSLPGRLWGDDEGRPSCPRSRGRVRTAQVLREHTASCSCRALAGPARDSRGLPEPSGPGGHHSRSVGATQRHLGTVRRIMTMGKCVRELQHLPAPVRGRRGCRVGRRTVPTSDGAIRGGGQPEGRFFPAPRGGRGRSGSLPRVPQRGRDDGRDGDALHQRRDAWRALPSGGSARSLNRPSGRQRADLPREGASSPSCGTSGKCDCHRSHCGRVAGCVRPRCITGSFGCIDIDTHPIRQRRPSRPQPGLESRRHAKPGSTNRVRTSSRGPVAGGSGQESLYAVTWWMPLSVM